MPLLPAVVPSIPETRAEIVPARLARKLAPLFGVPWPDGPFGERTWVSDFGRITLSEIARGAPLPTRARAGELADRDVQGWEFVDRVAVTGGTATLPNEIANATLNRFGPDTKAAVVLTATNRLLDPVTEAITLALPTLVDDGGRPVSPGLRLAAWAALVIEVFRSQPALVAAGIRARAIQRPLTLVWDLPHAPGAADVPLTRCEISAPATTTAPTRPRDLDAADATFRALGLPDEPTTSPLTRDRLHDAIVGQLLDQLLIVGTNQDASHLWISERAPESLAIEALIPAADLVDRFVRQALRAIGLDESALDAPTTLPRPPDPGTFAGLSVLARRTTVLAHLAVLRQLLSSATAWEASRADVLDRLDTIRALLDRGLPDDDPVGAVAACRLALLRVRIARFDAHQDLSAALADLRRTADVCEALYVRGILDRAAAAEIVSACNVEINAVRLFNAAQPGSALPTRDELDAELRRRWQCYLEMIEVPEDALAGGPAPVGLLAYHLHNYASYLAGHPDCPEDLTTALRLFRDLVIPARAEFVERSGIFEPLRPALQMATRTTTALVESAVARGSDARAREWAALGAEWIRRALVDPGTRALLAEPTEAACRFALRAIPALLLAVELDVAGSGPADLDEAARMLAVAQQWEHDAVGAEVTRHVRHREIADLMPRLAAARAHLATNRAAQAC